MCLFFLFSTASKAQTPVYTRFFTKPVAVNAKFYCYSNKCYGGPDVFGLALGFVVGKILLSRDSFVLDSFISLGAGKIAGVVDSFHFV